jgi:adenylate kinase family enzyme
MEGRGRADDLSGFDETRLEIFRNNIAPLLEFYEGSDMYTIDASQSIAEVRAQVDELLD